MWVTAQFGVMFKSFNVTKAINIFLAHFHFLKKLQIFLMPLGIVHAAPTLPKSPLISSYQQQKHLAYNWRSLHHKMISIYFLLLVDGGCTLSISPCWPLPTYPHRVVKGPYFEAWNRPEPEITSPNPARAGHLFLKPVLGLKAKFAEGAKICATAE